MDIYSDDYPVHVKYLISDIENCTSPVEVLSKYIYTLPEDPVLTEIFKVLGYSETSDCFTRQPSHIEVLQSLRSYNDTKDPSEQDYSEWELYRGIKDEFLKTFNTNKLQDISEAFDLGLSPFEPEESLTALWSTPIKKIPDSISTEESTPQNCRGLKYLTSKVKSIIYSKGFFSYKEVSDELVKELELSDGLDRAREEKNILRRVYDSLNVLIASEVVVKRGKKYVWQHSASDLNESSRKKLKKIKKRVSGKKKELREEVKKFIAINQLLLRNKEVAEQNVIHFPFIIVCTEEHPDNVVKMESNPSHKDICIKFRKEIELYGDMEVLQKLDLGLEINIPEELQSLLKC